LLDEFTNELLNKIKIESDIEEVSKSLEKWLDPKYQSKILQERKIGKENNKKINKKRKTVVNKESNSEDIVNGEFKTGLGDDKTVSKETDPDLERLAKITRSGHFRVGDYNVILDEKTDGTVIFKVFDSNGKVIDELGKTVKKEESAQTKREIEKKLEERIKQEEVKEFSVELGGKESVKNTEAVSEDKVPKSIFSEEEEPKEFKEVDKKDEKDEESGLKIKDNTSKGAATLMATLSGF